MYYVYEPGESNAVGRIGETQGKVNRNERVHADVCVGTCSQHQWSVSALKAPKRRGATLGARHNAASTHPLSDFLSPPLVLYLRVVLSLCVSIRLSIGVSLPSPSLTATLFLHLFTTDAPEICENLRGAILPLHRRLPSSFEEKESSRILLPPRQPFPELLFLFFSRFPMTRAGHVPYCWCRVDRVTEALFCELELFMKTQNVGN